MITPTDKVLTCNIDALIETLKARKGWAMADIMEFPKRKDYYQGRIDEIDYLTRVLESQRKEDVVG